MVNKSFGRDLMLVDSVRSDINHFAAFVSALVAPAVMRFRACVSTAKRLAWLLGLDSHGFPLKQRPFASLCSTWILWIGGTFVGVSIGGELLRGGDDHPDHY